MMSLFEQVYNFVVLWVAWNGFKSLYLKRLPLLKNGTSLAFTLSIIDGGTRLP